MKSSTEFLFGVSRVKVSRAAAAKMDAIAKTHGFCLVEAHLPDGYRRWFAGPNRGEPFNGRTQAAIEEKLSGGANAADHAARRKL